MRSECDGLVSTVLEPFILDCGHENKNKTEHFSGYGNMPDGRKLCYDCLGALCREALITDDRVLLYLCNVQYDPFTRTSNPLNTGVGSRSVRIGATISADVQNWCGSFKVKATGRVGKHNIAGKRFDVWFIVEGEKWHGVSYGENTEILHCRKLKKVV